VLYGWFAVEVSHPNCVRMGHPFSCCCRQNARTCSALCGLQGMLLSVLNQCCSDCYLVRWSFFFALVFAGLPGWAQDDSPQIVRLAPGLFSLRGTDPSSGTEYLRLLLAADMGESPLSLEPSPQASPTFTIECTQRRNRRELHFYVNFGGVKDTAFTPPFKPTPTDLYPPCVS